MVRVLENIVVGGLIVGLTVLSFAQQSTIEKKATESLQKLYGDSVHVSRRVIHLTTDEKKQIQQQAGSQWLSDSIGVYVAQSTTRNSIGYGFVDNVKGKVQYITYLVVIQPGGEVKDVDILVYRESYGGEIAYESFRKQFRSKSSSHQIKVGKDIRNISGATISVHAITAGVRRVMASYEVLKHRL